MKGTFPPAANTGGETCKKKIKSANSNTVDFVTPFYEALYSLLKDLIIIIYLFYTNNKLILSN